MEGEEILSVKNVDFKRDEIEVEDDIMKRKVRI